MNSLFFSKLGLLLNVEAVEKPSKYVSSAAQMRKNANLPTSNRMVLTDVQEIIIV